MDGDTYVGAGGGGGGGEADGGQALNVDSHIDTGRTCG